MKRISLLGRSGEVFFRFHRTFRRSSASSYGRNDSDFLPWYEAGDARELLSLGTEENLADYFSNNKLFENEKIVCYSKPTGVHPYTTRSREGARFTGQHGKSLTIEDISHVLAKKLQCDSLRVCHAPHPLYSGATILAKDDLAAKAVRNAFKMAKKRGEYPRTDLAITVGIPSPETDIINVPIEKKEVNGTLQALPVLNPTASKLKQETVKSRRTKYSVFDAANGMGLVKLQPRDGLGQQSLLHLACKMCQVLGDKEFSNRIVTIRGVRMLLDPDKVQIGIQNLSPRVKLLLALNSDKDVQNLPLHVHRWKLALPKSKELGLPDGELITAPLPMYFTVNLRLLGLKIPTG